MKTKLFFLAMALMFCAVPMFAQGGAATSAEGGTSWVPVAAGFAMAIGSGLCALGQGRAVAGACEGIARNPSAFASIRFADSGPGAYRIARSVRVCYFVRFPAVVIAKRGALRRPVELNSDRLTVA